MADSILRLRVESNEYDSKIKRAQQGLLHMEEACRKAGKSMNDMDKDQKQFVQSLGSMQTVSTSVRGKIGELSGAFVELRSQYNRLTEEEKKGDFGRAMSANLEQLKTRVAEAKAELKDIQKELDGSDSVGGGGFLSGMGGKMSGALQVFAGNMLTKAAGAVANLGSEMAGMVQQGIALAKQGEGIRIAFERLGRGDILDGLREATHGTVTDLELMKAAVKFNDFRLPVEELGTMLAFAQQKAKDTGQSVDYMVDSIVTGLGRKSLMILDNLGLSAAEIKDKMAETGDMTKAVGAIIREQMAKAGDYVETAADRAAQANVSLQNKMEELGRKFAPLQEASNSLWTSMKIGILDVVGGPLARLLNGLTEAGRLRNMLDKMNGQEGSGNTKVDQQLKQLNDIRKGGGTDTYFDTTLRGMVEDYNRQIMDLDAKIKDADNLSPGQKGTKFVRDQLQEWNEQMKALQIMRDQLKAGAKELSKPVDVKIETKGAEQNVESLKVKLIELEAQRKKAIAAGDTDLSKNLAKQITQTKADIKALNPNALKTTHTATPQERAASKVSEAERTYTETLLKNSIRLEAGIDSTLDNKKKELSAQERLFDAYNDAYATYKDPKYKEASAEAAEKIKQLAAEVKTATDAQEAAKKSARELESAQKKLADAQQKLADAQATGSATAVYKAQKDVDKQQEAVNRLQNPTLPQPAKPTGFEALKQSVHEEIKFDQMQVDENTLHTLLQTALKNGLEGLTVDYGGLQQKIAQGIDIPESTWQELQDEINEKLQALGIDPIQIDFKTGNVKSQAKEMAKDWQEAGSAIQAVGSAMSQIEDPAAKVAGIVAQAIATVSLTFASSLKGTVTPWDWIAAAAAGTATMVSTIAAIKSSTKGGFAEGGIVPGNSFSGDNLRISDYGINSGELILSRSQQDSIAAQLTGDDGQASGGIPYVTGETLFLGVSNTLRRQGRGEIVTTSMLRRAGIRL